MIAPDDLTRVFFSDNGSTAMEIAVKLAFQFWRQQQDPAARRRTRFVTFEGAYHGDTLGAVSVGGIDTFHAAFAPLAGEVVLSLLQSPAGRGDAAVLVAVGVADHDHLAIAALLQVPAVDLGVQQ